MAALGRRALGHESRLHRDLDLMGRGSVHARFYVVPRLIQSGSFNRDISRLATGRTLGKAATNLKPEGRLSRMSVTEANPAPAPASDRDLRLDLFRGIALWLIFLDHIPSNIVSWVTIRNYGFSDATEIFIFISGFTAAFVYGRAMRDRGFIVSGARILKRAWQIYVAHIFLFMIYLAEIAYVARGFNNPLYAEEAGILDFLQQPDVTIVEALLLKFKPSNMDVLPLYIVLLIAVSADPVAVAAQGNARLDCVGGALCGGLGIRLEPAGLSERALVFQSVRLATPVCVRRLVRARRLPTGFPAC